jgi:hypothetical protein
MANNGSSAPNPPHGFVNQKRMWTKVFAWVLMLMTGASLAQAQSLRTWVSGVGDNANTCDRTAPCRTFSGALSKTTAGGEISVLDSGSFGPVTITQAVTISGTGHLTSILAPGTNGIVINAGVSDVVILRDLSINGVGTGLNGIRYLAGKRLLIDNVTISGFTTRGIEVSLAASSSVIAKDTTITDAPTGIRITTTSGIALATLNNVHLHGLTNGLEAAANSRVSITRSVISNNSSNGILASSAASQINLENCLVALNDLVGINASVSGSAIRISNNDIQSNTVGISIAAGAIVSSANNNRVVGNGSTMAPNGPAIPVQ